MTHKNEAGIHLIKQSFINVNTLYTISEHSFQLTGITFYATIIIIIFVAGIVIGYGISTIRWRQRPINIKHLQVGTILRLESGIIRITYDDRGDFYALSELIFKNKTRKKVVWISTPFIFEERISDPNTLFKLVTNMVGGDKFVEVKQGNQGKYLKPIICTWQS